MDCFFGWYDDIKFGLFLSFSSAMKINLAITRQDSVRFFLSFFVDRSCSWRIAGVSLGQILLFSPVWCDVRCDVRQNERLLRQDEDFLVTLDAYVDIWPLRDFHGLDIVVGHLDAMILCSACGRHRFCFVPRLTAFDIRWRLRYFVDALQHKLEIFSQFNYASFLKWLRTVVFCFLL